MRPSLFLNDAPADGGGVAGAGVKAALSALSETLSGPGLAKPVPVELPPVDLTPVPIEEVVEVLDPETGLPVKPEAEADPVDTPETPEVVEEVDPALVVEVPGWRPGEPDVEIRVETPEAAEQLRALVNSRELKQEGQARLREAAALVDEVNTFRAKWKVDPVGTAQATLDPERQAHLALSILAQPEILQALAPTIEGMLTDENALTVVRSKLEAEALRLQRAGEQAIEEERAITRNVRDLRRSVEALIPQGLTAAQRHQWREDALNSLGAFAEQNNVRIIHPLDVPAVLASRLRAFNVNPQDAAQAIRDQFTRKRPDTAGSPSRPPASPPVSATKIVAAARARGAAASSAPAGAGAPTAALPVAPPGTGLKGRIDLLRKTTGARP